MIELAGAEQLDRLFHQLLVGADLCRGGGEVALGIGDDVEADILAEVPRLEIAASEEWAVDEGFVVGGFVGDGVARLACLAQCTAGLPAAGPGYAGADGDLPGEPASGIQRDLVGLQADHVGRHGDTPLVGCGGREEVETHIEGSGAGGNIDVESEDVDFVALPHKFLAVCRDDEAGEFGDLPAGAMVAGEPFGEQQRRRASRSHRDGFGNVEDAANGVGGVDFQGQRAGEGRVLRRRDCRGDRQRCGLGNWGGSGGSGEQGK